MADDMGDVYRGLEVVEASSLVGDDMLGDSIQNLSNGLDTISYRTPLGVCAGIAPFNFPAMIALWMFPLAIACGNTYVLKPTEKAPSASMLLVKYLHDLGLPQGVVNIVHGGKETVNELLTHVDIRAISFVGSNTVGEYVYYGIASSPYVNNEGGVGPCCGYQYYSLARVHGTLSPETLRCDLVASRIRCRRRSCCIVVAGWWVGLGRRDSDCEFWAGTRQTPPRQRSIVYSIYRLEV